MIYVLWPIVYRCVTSIDRWKNWFFFFSFSCSLSFSSNYVPIGDERNQIKERTKLPLGKKVFRWCQSSSMYAKTLFIQYNITNKTMNIKRRNKEKRNVRKSWNCSAYVLWHHSTYYHRDSSYWRVKFHSSGSNIPSIIDYRTLLFLYWLFLSNDQRQFNWHWIHCRLSFSHLSKLIIIL